MRNLLNPAAATLALGLLAAAPQAEAAAIIAQSRFDTGADGWRNGDFTVGNTTYDVDWSAAGFISVGDTHDQFTAFLAPGGYLGDRRDAIGGSLAFDLASDFPAFEGASLPYVTLKGRDVLLFGLITDRGPTEAFARYAVDLRPENFFAGSPEDGPDVDPVSAATFALVMSDLRQLSIRADIADGNDHTSLDNVVLTAGTGVPEPATWAVMVLGLGLAGSMLRRRRALVAGA